MLRIICTLLAGFVMLSSTAQEPLSYYLPDDVTYDKKIPTPDQYFKQQLGEWHLTHGQILNYMHEIADISDRAILYEYARSYENKPLVHLIFTSEENHTHLDELKELHVAYSDPTANIPVEGVPLVVSLTYGVHGNESSASNSSVLSAYYLAAAQGNKIDKLLNSTIIIVDPCLNPDGFTRHSTWANMHQSAEANGDANSMQFYREWPGGRTNHYWFDLNRDYLLLVNPETRGRVAKFHEWKPNVVTDHHESSPDFSFFFQPGVPSRNNPLTPSENYDFTRRIAEYHANFLDDIGSYYFSEENFDDYYFGKGSTYPDIHGSIGILFEQASIRGRIRETANGLKKLSLGIKNHFTVTLSTLEASMDLHDELLLFQREFYASALDLAEYSSIEAYVFGSKKDKIKTQKFVDFLNRHQIKVYPNDQEITVDNRKFEPGTSFIVPVKQSQYRLLTSIFEEVTSFRDTTFYDISTWTIPHAFDIPYARLTSHNAYQVSGEPVVAGKIEGEIVGGKSSMGYLFRWNEYSSPAALYRLQDAGLITKAATKGFSFEIDHREEQFTHGTILIPVNLQKLSAEQIYELVQNIVQETGIVFYGLTTGLSPSGPDMGSGSFTRLHRPEILMFIGRGTSSYVAGEIWHLMDQNYQIPITSAPTDRIGSIDLNRYNQIILPGGSYNGWSESDIQKLKTWTENGGILIACSDAAGWVARNQIGKTEFKDAIPPDSTRYLTYAERDEESRLHAIGGAIFMADMDLTHPLCYGYLSEDLAIFKRGTSVAKPSGIKYSEPVKFASQPYVSGWVSEENLERIKEAPVVSVQQVGRGKLISYHEAMNFRGFWMGTHKLLANSLFFGRIIQ